TAFIDGVAIGSPVAWTSRQDLTAAFPAATYPGIDRTLGIIGFDSTTLTNGTHSMFWIVSATNGEAEGIGSRYFTVLNRTTPAAGSSPAGGRGNAAAEVNAAGADWRPIRGRRGFNMDAPLHALEAAADGRQTLSGDELDRFELHLGDDTSSARLRYTG